MGEAGRGATTTTPTLTDVIPDSGGISTPAAADTMSFDDAFAAARAEEARLGIASGTGQFEYNGQMYSTATAEEAAAATTVSKQTERKGKYDVTANTQLSGGYDTSTLSDAEQTAFDAAVDRGDSNVANHFASVNRHRNKQDEFAASGFDRTVGRSLGLNDASMDQAEKYGGSVQTAINEGRAVDDGNPFTAVEVIDPTPTTSTGRRDDDDGGSTATTSSRSDDRDNNVASSGRTETQIQAEINAEINKIGKGNWNEKLNDLVSERDSARSNEGSSDDRRVARTIFPIYRGTSRFIRLLVVVSRTSGKAFRV